MAEVRASEQSRARYPDSEGYAERDGVRVFYEVYGDGEPTVLFLPTWSIVHSRLWKAQIPYFARHFRVVTFDGRGNGRSDRPREPEAYRPDHFAADALAVMDATGTERALTVSTSQGTLWNLFLCATQPDRVLAACFIGPLFPVCPPMPGYTTVSFNAERESYEGWEKYNRHYWRRDWPGFVQFWAETCLPERHSTKQIEDSISYGLDTDAETIVATLDGGGMAEAETLAELFEQGGAEALTQLAEQVRSPVMVACGDRDAVTPLAWAEALAAATGGRLEVFRGNGHAPQSRHPVRFNLLLRELVESVAARAPTPTAVAAPRGRAP
jgi:pimeloyl-ACP methyl ester carboxylesterase